MRPLIALLFSRLTLFACFQAMMALALHSWDASVKYWILTATLTNLISIALLILLTRKEGVSYLSLFRINKKEWKTDLKYFIGLAVISVPVVLGPGMLLNEVLYPASDHYAQLLFQPMSMSLVYVLLVAFPVTIGLAELPTYFGYIMPRLQQKMNSRFLGFALPVIFLSVQHCTLPLVFEWEFVAYRALAFLPFSILLGVALNKRPSLLIYFSVFHALLDAMTVMMLLKTTASG